MTQPVCRASALVAVLLVAACGTGLLEESTPELKTDIPAYDTMTSWERVHAQQVLEYVNAERVNAGFEPLAWSEPAAGVAYRHCVDMQARSYFSHYTPDGVGPCERLRATGMAMLVCGGENIALGQTTAVEVMVEWMGSAGHRANILSPYFTHVGIAVRAGSTGPWWAQVFYQPMP